MDLVNWWLQHVVMFPSAISLEWWNLSTRYSDTPHRRNRIQKNGCTTTKTTSNVSALDRTTTLSMTNSHKENIWRQIQTYSIKESQPLASGKLYVTLKGIRRQCCAWTRSLNDSSWTRSYFGRKYCIAAWWKWLNSFTACERHAHSV